MAFRLSWTPSDGIFHGLSRAGLSLPLQETRSGFGASAKGNRRLLVMGSAVSIALLQQEAPETDKAEKGLADWPHP